MPSAASKTDVTETSQKSSQSQVSPPDTHDSDTLSTETTELINADHFDPSKSQITQIKQSSLPEEQRKALSFCKSEDSNEDSKILCQISQDSLDDQSILSPESTTTSPRSGSPQPGQLELDPEEIDPYENPEFSDESSEDDQISKFESTDTTGAKMSSEETYETNDAIIEQAYFQSSVPDELITILDTTKPPETDVASFLGSLRESPPIPIEPLKDPQEFCDVEPSANSGFPLDIFQCDKNNENTTGPFAPVSLFELNTNSQPEIPAELLTILHKEGSTTDIQFGKEEFDDELSPSANSVKEKISRNCFEDEQLQCRESSSLETTQIEDVSSVSDVTPETVTAARHFSFEELMPYSSAENNESSPDKERSKSIGEHSGDSLKSSPEWFTSTVEPKREMTLSASKEEYCIPPRYAETCSTTTISNHMPPEYAKVVHSGVERPTAECSDQEPYFDCKQATSDFSETEPDEPDSKVISDGYMPLDHISNPTALDKVDRKVLLSSGSEDYEDATFVHEPLYNVDEGEEELLQNTETSDDEFTLCEASQPPALCCKSDDTDKYLTRVR